MVFKPNPWVSELPEVPDTVPIPDFMLDEQHGRFPLAKSKDSYTCGISGKSLSPQDQKIAVDHLARSLHKELGWEVNKGSEYDKVAGIFALNTVRDGSSAPVTNADLPRLIS